MRDIKLTKRPIVPYENPDWSMYFHLFKENLLRFFHKKRSYTRNDNHIATVFSTPQAALKYQCNELV